jgi:hypothetical protein
MVPAQSLHSTTDRLDSKSLDGSSLDGSSLEESPLGRDDFADDEYSDDIVSLLEENARLRKLVVRLSEIVLRSVADERPAP